MEKEVSIEKVKTRMSIQSRLLDGRIERVVIGGTDGSERILEHAIRPNGESDINLITPDGTYFGYGWNLKAARYLAKQAEHGVETVTVHA